MLLINTSYVSQIPKYQDWKSDISKKEDKNNRPTCNHLFIQENALSGINTTNP